MGAAQIPVVSGSTFYCSLLQSPIDFPKVSAFRLKFFLFNLSMIFTDIVIILLFTVFCVRWFMQDIWPVLKAAKIRGEEECALLN